MTTCTVAKTVRDLVAETTELWRASGSKFPHLGKRYSEKEQQWREELLDRAIEEIDRKFRQTRVARNSTEHLLRCLTAAVIEMTTCALDFRDPYVEELLRDGFSQVGVDFGQSARKLDPALSIEDLLQACRNAWVACGLQLLFGGEINLTPAIFAYSMLYPYSDNYLDDRSLSSEAKRRFNARFRSRLEGNTPLAENWREAMMWQLVGLIESEYSRASCPDVFDSLLAIHEAQQHSILQMDKSRNGGLDVLNLTITKGGTSVLADAFLARGTLTEMEARFAFQWGVLLQISDDLQDFEPDRRRGSLTLFSRTAAREPLDEITNQTMQFGRRVLDRMGKLRNADARLSELLARSSQSLLLRSVASLPELYTKEYLAELEKYSPYRFAFLRDRESRFASRSKFYVKRLELLFGQKAGNKCPEGARRATHAGFQ